LTARIVFAVIALALIGVLAWAYYHDAELNRRVKVVELGDPNEHVRDLLGEPWRQGSCGSLSAAPSACRVEYVYRYYFRVFQPEFEVVWFDAEGKVIGSQHIRRPF